MKGEYSTAFKKQKLTIISLLFAILLGICVPFMGKTTVVADISSMNVQSYYKVNTMFDVPVAEGYKSIVISPSSKVYHTNKLSLDETGIWTLRFENDNEIEDKTFTVYNNMYDVSGDDTATVYGGSSVFPDDGNGLIVTLKPNTTFKYNEVINLDELSSIDDILQFGFITTSVGTPDLSELDIYLTDIYDSSNYIKIVVKNPNNSSAGSYPGKGSLAATFSGQTTIIGCEKMKGEKPLIHSNVSNYGAYTYLDFEGKTDAICKIGYDHASKTVYSNSKWWYSGKLTGDNARWMKAVADLDDLNYAENYEFAASSRDKVGFTEEFKGFTTNEVYLSIQGKSYSSSATKLFIKSIVGADLTATGSYDTRDPYLTVDNVYGDDLPKGEVNKAYSLFDSYAVDNELSDVSVVKEVFMTHAGTRMYNLPVINDAFTPNLAGTYEIVYSAKDGYLRKTEKSYFVEVVSDVAVPTISFDEEGATSCSVGNEVQLSTVSASSHSGNATVKNEVVFNSKVVATDVESFTPQSAGTYTVNYYVYDYIGQASQISYEFTASIGAPVMVNEPMLPYGLIAGKTYAFPTVTALDYSNIVDGKPAEITAKLYVTDDTGRKLVDGSYTVSATSSQASILLEYALESSAGASTYTKTIPVSKISDYSKDLSKYFVGDATATQTIKGVELHFNADGNARFINKVLAEQFALTFAVQQANNNASQFNVYLKDSMDADKVVKLSVKKNADSSSTNSFVSVNDGKSLSVNASFYNEKDVVINYNNSLETFNIADTIFSIDTYLSGEAFEGFTSNAVLLEIEAVGVDSGSKFCLTVIKLNNQTFKLVTGDQISAEVFYTAPLLYKYQSGTTIESIPVVVVDVLQPTSSATIRVVSPSGKTVSDVNGVPLNGVDATVGHNFKLSEYGNYRCTYTFDDGVSGVQTKMLLISAPDNVPPTVSAEKTEVSCKVGETVELPVLTVSDNIDNASKISAIAGCYSPDGRVTLADVMIDGETVSSFYTFNAEGEWTVRYMVYDSAYNVASISIKVVVRK